MLCSPIWHMTDTNCLANPPIRSALYGGNTHAYPYPLTAVRMVERFCRMRYKGNITWSNQPGTPIPAFRKWIRSSIGRRPHWRQGNLQLSLPAGAETFSQAHQIRQVWRHILQEMTSTWGKWRITPAADARRTCTNWFGGSTDSNGIYFSKWQSHYAWFSLQSSHVAQGEAGGVAEVFMVQFPNGHFWTLGLEVPRTSRRW